jgi:hypothetical protein
MRTPRPDRRSLLPPARRRHLGRRVGLIALALVVAGLAGCSRSTARLAPEVEERLNAEGIVRRADDILVRRTHGLGTRRSGWEEMTASILVTHRRVFIHDGTRTLADLEGGLGDRCRVNRDHDRVTLRLRGDRAATSWSFHPPEDAPGWTDDVRAVLKSEAQPDTSGD